ncbi:alpha/beta hydrolase [Halochromatium salexigens]|uniref:Alpha/beta hydrolase n=2 Tax=Halochromatium salexigens TaxID=49447 RepID=A0AAJ0XDY5_HALSE|nr:alpha/beta hydrolase [Halochromatium salexigens]
MADGYRLPFQRWGRTDRPRIVVLGLHGFNDYSQAFRPLGEHLATLGITTYAFDQRGFGRTRQAGRWHGSDRLTADLRTLIGLLRARHPQARLILIGESMGAAVALSADATAPLDVDGLVLIAPAVWSRDSMPWYQRAALALAARTLPGLKLTGDGIQIAPSDNKPMLIAMGRDPLVIKATRIEALWGVTNVMDQAVTWPDSRRHPDGQPPTLILYGERDSIIPARAFCRFIDAVPLDAAALRLLLYAEGWHMLPRDLQGARVRADIATWLLDPSAALPSGEVVSESAERLRRFCAATTGPPDGCRAKPF